MDLAHLALLLAQSATEDESTETPWLTVIIVLAVFFVVVSIVIGRLRRKAAEIE